MSFATLAARTARSSMNSDWTQSTPLIAGDRVRFGNQIFKYLAADALESQYHECVFRIVTTDGFDGRLQQALPVGRLGARGLDRLQRDPTPVVVMLLDLDKFKSINDTYGHLAGDAVLVEIARRGQAQLRSGEIFARYGGEEFAVLAPRMSIAVAAQVGERIRMAIAASPVVFESQAIQVTTSIGVAETTNPATTASDLIATADARLYRAKDSGRNLVCSED